MSIGKIFSFADDTAILYSGESWDTLINDLKIDLEVIIKWFGKNSLTINLDKSCFVPFGCYRDSLPDFEGINLNIYNKNIVLKRQNVIRYLGVEIDGNLRWEEHIRKIRKKIRYLPFAFYKMRNFITLKTLNIIYLGLFESVMSYGIVTWGGASRNIIKPLDILNRFALKAIYNKTKRYSTKLLYEETKLLNVKQIFWQKAILQILKTKEYEYCKNSKQTRQMSNMKIKFPVQKINKEIYKINGSACRTYFLFHSLPYNLSEKENITYSVS